MDVGLTLAALPAAPSPADPVSMRPVAVLDARDGYLVDNFEGLARHRANRFFMVSDDNDLFMQRTLLLYVDIILD